MGAACRRSTRGRATTARSASIPKDRNRVYLLGSNRGFYISDDGGKTFRDVFSTIHSEDHALWIDPDDTNHLIVGGDGGVSISWDRGVTWLFRDNLPIGQFYEISADMQDPVHASAAGCRTTATGACRAPRAIRNGIANRDGFNIGSGDGFYARIDPTDRDTGVHRVAGRPRESRQPRDARAPGHFAGRARPGTEPRVEANAQRWNWNTPIVMSSFDPKVLYIGSHVRVPLRRPRRDVEGDQPRPHRARRSRHAADDGRAASPERRCRATTARRRSSDR